MSRAKLLPSLVCTCSEERDENDAPIKPDIVTCGACGFKWCNRCDPAPSPRCWNEINHVTIGRKGEITVNATYVVGYAYDADTHCEGCTRERFGTAMDPGEGVADAPKDSEDNEISAIFAGEDAYEDCAECDKGQCNRCPCGTSHDCSVCEGEGKVSRVCGDCGDELIS